MFAPKHRLHSARGFTLVEILVTLVVMSIGLLGLAALQLTSLKANHGSASRTQAVYLVYDIIDRMRANSNAAGNGDYNIAIGTAAAGGTVAGDDLVSWKQNITTSLPQGSVAADGSVTYNPATNLVTVQVVWDDTHANISPTAVPDPPITFTVTTQLFN